MKNVFFSNVNLNEFASAIGQLATAVELVGDCAA
jgi:hypothetical protein